MQRAANSASVNDIVLILRGVLPNGPDMRKMADTNVDFIVDEYYDVVIALLKATPRPLSSSLKDAATLAWKIDGGVADTFAYKISQAVAHCRPKKKQSTSGKKLSRGTHKVVEFMNSVPSPTNAKLGKFARMVRRHLSDESDHMSSNEKLPVTISSEGGSCASSSTGTFATIASLSDLYGTDLTGHHRHSECVELLSSQEVEVVEVVDKPATKSKPVQYFDNIKCAVVREFPGGKRDVAKMVEGPRGMAIASFAGEKSFETECPNLLLKPVVHKRPAALVKKKPAAVMDDVAQIDEPAPIDEAAGADDSAEPLILKAVVSSKKKLLYSKVYHKEKLAAKRRGMDSPEAKRAAREAAQEATKE